MSNKRIRSFKAGLAGMIFLCACGEQAPQTPPRQLSGSPFHYPEDLWDAGVEGETIVRLFVTASGTVDSARVETSSGYAAFDSAAVTGAYDVRFEPARSGEEPKDVWVLLPVEFDMPADTASGGS